MTTNYTVIKGAPFGAEVGETIMAIRNIAGVTSGNFLTVTEVVPPIFVKALDLDKVEHMLIAGDYCTVKFPETKEVKR